MPGRAVEDVNHLKVAVEPVWWVQRCFWDVTVVELVTLVALMMLKDVFRLVHVDW